MSLLNKMKTDITLATGGVWINLTAHPNDDAVLNDDGSVNTPATIPGFLVGRQSTVTNPNFAAAMSALAKRDRPAGEQLTIEDGIIADNEVFIGGILLGWRNFMPTEEGTVVEYSKSAAEFIFNDPSWADLKSTLLGESTKASNYAAGQRKAAVKNLPASSGSTSTAGTGTKKRSTSK